MSESYEICHECGSKMYRDTRPDNITYKGETVTVQQPGWYCSGCDEAVLSGKDVKATEPAFLELKAKVEGLLTPEEIKAIRKKLHLSQAAAGEILGGGPRAFYKYENGLTLLSRPMSNQLTLLANDPARIDELRT
jgi:HTH-type transcriptional regulator/antitoxin MqsA